MLEQILSSITASSSQKTFITPSLFLSTELPKLLLLFLQLSDLTVLISSCNPNILHTDIPHLLEYVTLWHPEVNTELLVYCLP